MTLRSAAGLVSAALVLAMTPTVAIAKVAPAKASRARTAAAKAPVKAVPAKTAPAAAPAAPHVTVETLTAGSGDKVPEHAYVLVNYKGTLKDGTVFDQAQYSALGLDEVVPGFTQGIVGMQRGGKYRVTIPPELGYGAEASGPIPANSTLVFEIDLLDFKTPAEIQAMAAQQSPEPVAQ